MARIIKNPEERRIELIDAAEELFIEKGFEQTLISDIVKKLGIAQGTFYYYFKSKDEVLDSIMERVWDEFADQIRIKIGSFKIDPIQKLQMSLLMMFNPDKAGIEKRKHFKVIENQGIMKRFHQQFDEARIKRLKPIILEIVKEGIEKKLFGEIRHPEELVDITFYGINMYMHINYPNFKEKAFFIEKMEGLEEMLERILGVESGTFNFHF